jgi:hypothetical protein
MKAKTPSLTPEDRAGRIERDKRIASESLARERHRQRINQQSVLISRSEAGTRRPAVMGVAA